MVTEKFVMQTELTASDDGRHTYEVRRMWSEQGRKGLVLELYPTLSAGRCGELDLSTMHLLNHTKDFGWGGVRIINLYSLFFYLQIRKYIQLLIFHVFFILSSKQRQLPLLNIIIHP